MINKAEAHGFAYEIKIDKKMNWCMLAEWTIRDQLHRLQSLETTLGGKFVGGLDLDNFVD
jgi:hypothetical protein